MGDLRTIRVATKSVPRLLAVQGKENSAEACSALKGKFQKDFNFYQRSRDETRCYCSNPEMKQQSSQWKTSRQPRRKKCVKRQNKLFFYVRGVVYLRVSSTGANEFYTDRATVCS